MGQVIASSPERGALSVAAETKAPGFRVAAYGLARNDGRVVFVIPAEAGIQGVWVGHFVSEQRSEAIFAKANQHLGDCFVTCGSSQ